jgi:hypothetical protein
MQNRAKVDHRKLLPDNIVQALSWERIPLILTDTSTLDTDPATFTPTPLKPISHRSTQHDRDTHHREIVKLVSWNTNSLRSVQLQVGTPN